LNTFLYKKSSKNHVKKSRYLGDDEMNQRQVRCTRATHNVMSYDGYNTNCFRFWLSESPL